MDLESGAEVPGVLVPDSSQQPLQDWAVEPDHAAEPNLSDGESDGVLEAVDPNQVFSVSTATAQMAPATIYQLVYDISGVGGATEAPGPENVISIELEEWNSQLLLSDSCIINEVPLVPAVPPPAPPTSLPDPDLLFADLQLTEEEQKLLSHEGVSLPHNLPLTKAEERILKKVRRKIRNKQSAQDSRRRRKEYIDGLESRAAACSAQNRELQKTVEKLEKYNTSLLDQLQQLQSLIRQTVSKGAQTSTCLLIILVSLGLIILPSFSPSGHRAPPDDDYRPTGVISRNILTDPSSYQPLADQPPRPAAWSDPPPPPAALSQSAQPEGGVGLREPIENLHNLTFDGTTWEDGQSGNSSEAVAGQSDLVAMTAGLDVAKPAHADEM